MHGPHKPKPVCPASADPSTSRPNAGSDPPSQTQPGIASAFRQGVSSEPSSQAQPTISPPDGQLSSEPSVPADTLAHTVPCRQKQAREFLQGRAPGVMQAYAPNAHADPDNGFVETDDTVHRLAHWREEAIY